MKAKLVLGIVLLSVFGCSPERNDTARSRDDALFALSNDDEVLADRSLYPGLLYATVEGIARADAEQRDRMIAVVRRWIDKRLERPGADPDQEDVVLISYYLFKFDKSMARNVLLSLPRQSNNMKSSIVTSIPNDVYNDSATMALLEQQIMRDAESATLRNRLDQVKTRFRR